MSSVGFKSTILLASLLLLITLSSCTAEGFKDDMHPYYSDPGLQDGSRINLRKLLVSFLDYDDTGANPKHDPRKKPGKP